MKLDESLNYIKQALTLEPNNGAYLDSLGWAYFKLGKYDLAEENLTKAAAHMGTDPTVQEHLGDLYQKTGRLKLAAAHWDRAVQEWNQNRSRRTRHRSLRQSPAKTRRRQSKAGQRRFRQAINSRRRRPAGCAESLAREQRTSKGAYLQRLAC